MSTHSGSLASYLDGDAAPCPSLPPGADPDNVGGWDTWGGANVRLVWSPPQPLPEHLAKYDVRAVVQQLPDGSTTREPVVCLGEYEYAAADARLVAEALVAAAAVGEQMAKDCEAGPNAGDSEDFQSGSSVGDFIEGTSARAPSPQGSGRTGRDLAGTGLRPGPSRWGVDQAGADAVDTTQLRPNLDQLARDLLDDHCLPVPEIGGGPAGYNDEALSCEEPVAT